MACNSSRGVCTRGYDAPETRTSGAPFSLSQQKATDCYSLGITVHKILVGRKPENLAISTELTASQTQLIEGLLESNPDSRFTINDALASEYITKENVDEQLGFVPEPTAPISIKYFEDLCYDDNYIYNMYGGEAASKWLHDKLHPILSSSEVLGDQLSEGRLLELMAGNGRNISLWKEFFTRITILDGV